MYPHEHDILLCIGTGKAFTDPKRLRYDSRQFFLKTPDEMAEAFKDFPDALLNTIGRLMGVVYPVTALFVIALGFVLVLLIHFSLVISQLAKQNKLLAQRIGLLQQELHDQGSP